MALVQKLITGPVIDPIIGNQMLINIFLKSFSCSNSIKFYVEELGMFDLINNFGTGFCTLRAKAAPNLDIILGDHYNETGPWPALALSVDDCYAELNRLKDVQFASGGGIIQTEDGRLEVFEYPGGRNIRLRDPDNHEIMLFEYLGDPV